MTGRTSASPDACCGKRGPGSLLVPAKTLNRRDKARQAKLSGAANEIGPRLLQNETTSVLLGSWLLKEHTTSIDRQNPLCGQECLIHEIRCPATASVAS